MAILHFADRREYLVATLDEALEPWLAQGYEPLWADAAERVVERLLLSYDPRALKRIWQRIEGDDPPLVDAPDRRERLRRVVAGPRAKLRVLQRRQERQYRVRELQAPPKPKSFAEQMQSITLLVVEEFGNPPAAKLSYALALEQEDARSGTFDVDGGARQDGLRPGAGSLELADVHTGAWRERTEPPDGWLRARLSVTLLDSQGVPMGKHRLRVVFENGAAVAAELDELGYVRLEGAPSHPLRVEFPEFDPEMWR